MFRPAWATTEARSFGGLVLKVNAFTSIALLVMNIGKVALDFQCMSTDTFIRKVVLYVGKAFVAVGTVVVTTTLTIRSTSR